MLLLIRMSGIVFVAATVMPHLFGCVSTPRADLRQADIACATASSARDIARVATFMAEDSMTYPPNSPVIIGKDATLKLWSEIYANPGFAQSCQFQKAEV